MQDTTQTPSAPLSPSPSAPVGRGTRTCLIGCLAVAGTLALVVVLTALLTGWWVKRNLAAEPFEPVALTPVEQVDLEAKLQQLNLPEDTQSPVPVPAEPDDGPLPPYAEPETARRVVLTEKELNAMLANQTDFGSSARMDLSPGLMTLELLVPMEEGVPLVGGRTLRLTSGLALRVADGQLSLAVRGISLGGIPLPGAWWGDIKNQDLVQTFGENGGFWDAVSRGVASVEVMDGELVLELRE
jgi:hypothetical protein